MRTAAVAAGRSDGLTRRRSGRRGRCGPWANVPCALAVRRVAAVRPGSRKQSGPATLGDRLLNNATHTFDPKLPDELIMLNGGLLIMKLPVTGIRSRAGPRPFRQSRRCHTPVAMSRWADLRQLAADAKPRASALALRGRIFVATCVQGSDFESMSNPRRDRQNSQPGSALSVARFMFSPPNCSISRPLTREVASNSLLATRPLQVRQSRRLASSRWNREEKRRIVNGSVTRLDATPTA